MLFSRRPHLPMQSLTSSKREFNVGFSDSSRRFVASLVRNAAKRLQDPLLMAAPDGLDPDVAMEAAALGATVRLQIMEGTTVGEGGPGATQYSWPAMKRAALTVTDDSR